MPTHLGASFIPLSNLRLKKKYVMARILWSAQRNANQTNILLNGSRFWMLYKLLSWYHTTLGCRTISAVWHAYAQPAPAIHLIITGSHYPYSDSLMLLEDRLSFHKLLICASLQLMMLYISMMTLPHPFIRAEP